MIVRHIPGHDRAGADDSPIPDGHSLQNDGARSNENFPPDLDRPRASLRCVEPTVAGKHMKIIVNNHRPGSDEGASADFNRQTRANHSGAEACIIAQNQPGARRQSAQNGRLKAAERGGTHRTGHPNVASHDKSGMIGHADDGPPGKHNPAFELDPFDLGLQTPQTGKTASHRAASRPDPSRNTGCHILIFVENPSISQSSFCFFEALLLSLRPLIEKGILFSET
jgi:hypothetical protein